VFPPPLRATGGGARARGLGRALKCWRYHARSSRRSRGRLVVRAIHSVQSWPAVNQRANRREFRRPAAMVLSGRVVKERVQSFGIGEDPTPPGGRADGSDTDLSCRRSWPKPAGPPTAAGGYGSIRRGMSRVLVVQTTRRHVGIVAPGTRWRGHRPALGSGSVTV
jgi:hypothetical protein